MTENTRLILRPFRAKDAADVFAYLEKPTVNCFACMKLNSPEEAQAAVKEKMAHSEYCFSIVLKNTGIKILGSYLRKVRIHIQSLGNCVEQQSNLSLLSS